MSVTENYHDDISSLSADLARRQKTCDRAVARAITAGDKLPIPRAPEIQFVRQLYFNVLGSLNAAKIPITQKSVQTALELCFDEHRALNALDPNQPLKLRGEFNPAFVERTPMENTPDDSEAAQFMARLRQRLDERNQIKKVVSAGFRNIVDMKPGDSDEAALNKVKDRFIRCLQQQLEAGHPGITTNKVHPLWQDPMMLVYTLGSENIRRSVKEAMLYATVLTPDSGFDAPSTKSKPQPSHP